jgi:hypothetical protein
MAGSFGDLDESGERAKSCCRQPVAVSSAGVRRTSKSKKSPRSTPVADSGARLPLPRRRLARGRCLLVTEPPGLGMLGTEAEQLNVVTERFVRSARKLSG